MSRTTRLMDLLQALRGRRVPVTGAALAAELGVSLRTLYRDIAELNAQGASIQGEAGLGYVMKPGFFLPPLMFDADEMEAIVLGLRYVDQQGDDVLGNASRTALAKIAAVLPPEARAAIDSPIFMPGPDPDHPPLAVDVDTLRQAIRAQSKLRLLYRSGYDDDDGEWTDRIVWPVAIGLLHRAKLLMGWCELRNGFRTFRLDRIHRIQPTGERYTERHALLLDRLRKRLGAAVII